jgi:hypothetical protein
VADCPIAPCVQRRQSSPATDPQRDRTRLLHLLGRLRNGALLPAEVDLLADAVTALANQTTSGGKTRTASDVLVEHDVTRKAMCDALDAGYHLNWQQIIDTAQRSHAANTEWQREAELRRTALAAALDVHSSRDWGNLINTAENIRHERDRARQGETEAIRARQAAEQRADLADRVKRSAAKDAADALARAEQAEAALSLWRTGAYEQGRRADAAEQRADLAEAAQRDLSAALKGAWDTLASVRKAVADAKACGGEDAGCTVDHRDIITALIDGTAPARCCVCGSTAVVYRNHREQPFCGPCANGDYQRPQCAGCIGCGGPDCIMRPEPEPDAEPEPKPPTLVISVDLNGADITDLIRRIVKRAPGSPT